ncbi:Protein F55A11.4 a, partial [Aphelenchoides avenae]
MASLYQHRAAPSSVYNDPMIAKAEDQSSRVGGSSGAKPRSRPPSESATQAVTEAKSTQVTHVEESTRIPLEKIDPLKNKSKPTASLIQGSVKKETAIATHANLHGLSAEKEEEIRDLYERLDMDNDGTIDIRDLTLALTHKIPHIPSRLAPEILQRITKSNDAPVISFADFLIYVIEHEKRLELLFQDLDRNQDGYIDVKEIKNYCNELGIPLTDERAVSLVEQMDKSGSATINLSEFQDFMLLYPSADPHEIANFWRHNLIIDIGEDIQIPEDFSAKEIMSGVWWRHLVAGGIAGCMSRTCTAPLDRLKVFLQ